MTKVRRFIHPLIGLAFNPAGWLVLHLLIRKKTWWESVLVADDTTIPQVLLSYVVAVVFVEWPPCWNIVNTIFAELCTFTSKRHTVDMIFTVRQLQEKSIEQNQVLFLEVVWHREQRSSLYNFLEIGLSKFVLITRSLHKDSEAGVNVSSSQTDHLKDENGVKQGNLLCSYMDQNPGHHIVYILNQLNIFYKERLREICGYNHEDENSNSDLFTKWKMRGIETFPMHSQMK